MIESIRLDDVALALASLLVLVILFIWQRSPTGFDLRDLITDSQTGKASLHKTGQLVAMMVSTWVLVHETRAGRLSEWLFLGYMLAWTGVNIASKIVEGRKNEAI